MQYLHLNFFGNEWCITDVSAKNDAVHLHLTKSEPLCPFLLLLHVLSFQFICYSYLPLLARLHSCCCMLDSKSRTGGNVIIQVLTKDRKIINIASMNIGGSKQGAFFVKLGCLGLINSLFPDIE